MRKPFLFGLLLITILFNESAFSQQTIDKSEREQIVLEICGLLREYYVFPEIAETINDTLVESLKQGRYDDATNTQIFANLLTEDLQSVNHDLHLEAWPLQPSSPKSPESKDWVKIHLQYIFNHKNSNFGFVSAQRFEGNIGYLELVQFKPLNSESERIVRGAMDFLSNSDALIIDLRRNYGGHPEMVDFISSYFFDSPVQLTGTYNREMGGIQESWTLKDFYNRKMVKIPLYILTSAETISAPEGFAYNFQVLKRATIVGETTKGAANPGRFFRIRERILLSIATGYKVNPITKTNWEGVGIKPDIEVPAEQALDKALELAQDSAKIYRKDKEEKVAKYIERLRFQIAEVEKLVESDEDQAEELLARVLTEWFGREYLNRYFLLDVGDDYFKKEDFRMAILIFHQGTHYFPNYPRFYTLLADAYMKVGDEKNATKNYAKVLELNPNDRSALGKIGAIAKN